MSPSIRSSQMCKDYHVGSHRAQFILFLLYLTPLGQITGRFSNISCHFYADDIQLYCSFKENKLNKLSNLIACLIAIKNWLNNNFLQLNFDKTETLIIAPYKAIPLIRQHLGLLSSSVQSSLQDLGVVFDKAMSLAVTGRN